MNLNPFILVVVAGILCSATVESGAISTKLSKQPNIVLIIGDDISPDFGCNGGQANTPNIDQLAKGGVLFENAYVTASSCSPSRCSMISGRYPHNTGAPELHLGLAEGQFMFPLALKNSGYYCVQSGKWHMGDYARQAFDHVYEFEDAPDPGRAGRWIRCLEERPKDQPFFMWFAAYDAHRPWEPDPEGSPFNPAEAVLPAGVPDTPKSRQDLACYYDEVHRFDRHVGRVVAELERQGILENTVIIVVGDNGRPFPRNKTTLYENGMKVPLVVSWAGGQLPAGAESSALVSAMDIAPTILEIAGIPVPPQVQGISFLPLFKNPDARIRNVLFGERNWHVQRACARIVRFGNYLYIRNFSPQFYSFQMVDYNKGAYAELLRLKALGLLTPEQAEEFSTELPIEMLFNVVTDPQQLVNIAGNPENQAILNRMRKALSDWQDQTGDSIPEAEEMTPDRHGRETFERLYKEWRPPTGILPGQSAGAENINRPGPRWIGSGRGK